MQMKAIVVDDEMDGLLILSQMTKDISDIKIMKQFQEAEDAIDYVKSNDVNLAFLDIKLVGTDGIELGKKLQSIKKDIMLIYVTGYDKYAMEAIRLHAAAYLLKPYTEEDLKYAVESAKLLSRRFEKRIYAKTFGYFDLFVDGSPVMFKSAKAKELLALLIDREGGTVTSDQIIGTLWEDRPNDEATQNLCSKVARKLKSELKAYHAEDILIYSRGIRRVDTEKFGCDLYDLLRGDEKAKELFGGQYLMEYSWAEERLARLEKYITIY